MEPSNKLSQEIVVDLKLLRTKLMQYFPDVTCCTYAVKPFCIDSALLPVETGDQEKIIDIKVDETAKTMQKECSPIEFWLSMGSTYPTLNPKCCPQPLVSPSTRECAEGFSALIANKSKAPAYLHLHYLVYSILALSSTNYFIAK